MSYFLGLKLLNPITGPSNLILFFQFNKREKLSKTMRELLIYIRSGWGLYLEPIHTYWDIWYLFVGVGGGSIPHPPILKLGPNIESLNAKASELFIQHQLKFILI